MPSLLVKVVAAAAFDPTKPGRVVGLPSPAFRTTPSAARRTQSSLKAPDNRVGLPASCQSTSTPDAQSDRRRRARLSLIRTYFFSFTCVYVVYLDNTPCKKKRLSAPPARRVTNPETRLSKLILSRRRPRPLCHRTRPTKRGRTAPALGLDTSFSGMMGAIAPILHRVCLATPGGSQPSYRQTHQRALAFS